MTSPLRSPRTACQGLPGAREGSRSRPLASLLWAVAAAVLLPAAQVGAVTPGTRARDGEGPADSRPIAPAASSSRVDSGEAAGEAGLALDLQSARDAGWQEAVVSVRDAAPLLRFLTAVAGWELRLERALPASTLEFYAAAASGSPAAGGRDVASAAWPPSPQRREWLVTDAAGRPGFVRLVAFDQPRAPRIRAGAMPWDTGGLLSLMARSNDLAGVHDAALALGWTTFNDPTRLEMRDSGVSLDNVLLRGPDGVVVSVYERIAPRMAADPDLRRLRRPFNSMQTVRDLEAARRFYVDVLGFEVLSEGRFENPERAPNNFGLPANLVVAQPLRFAILGPRRSGPTQVELVQFPGVEGRDLASRAAPPALGLMALRFPVSRLAPLEARLRKAAIPLAAGPAMLDIAPYGRVRLLAVRAPDGAWLEFYERIEP